MTVLLVIRILFITVFVASAASKLRSRSAFNSFADSVKQVGVPKSIAMAGAITVIGLEAGIVILLLLPGTVIAGFGVAIGTLALFLIVIINQMRTDRVVTCNCFGSDGSPLGGIHLARNVTLIAIAMGGIAIAGLETSSTSFGDSATTSLIVAGPLGVVIGVLFARWEDLLYALGPMPAFGRR